MRKATGHPNKCTPRAGVPTEHGGGSARLFHGFGPFRGEITQVCGRKRPGDPPVAGLPKGHLQRA